MSDAQSKSTSPIVAKWLQFFFAPISPLPVSVFRIAFGAVMIVNLVFEYMPNFLFFCGSKSVYPESIVATYVWRHNPVFDLLWFLPNEDAFRMGFIWFAILMAVLVTIGFATRLSSIALFLCLLSINNHFPMFLNAGDNFARLISLFLCFTPCDRRLSIDALIRPVPIDQLFEPWAQRMIQLEFCFIYLVNVIYKASGVQWQEGSAVYYAIRLHEFYRMPLPAFLDIPQVSIFLSWSTLAVELSFALLLWPKKTRYIVMALALLFHLSLDWCFSLGIFEWVFIATLILFIYPQDLERLLKKREPASTAIPSQISPSTNV